jgi:MYXO-CTERM domain-containing protein
MVDCWSVENTHPGTVGLMRGRIMLRSLKTLLRGPSLSRAAALLGASCFIFGVSANADTVFGTYTVTINSVAGVTSACTAGSTGTFQTFTSGGILLEAPTSSTSGCYVGGYSGTAGAPTPNGTPTTFIDGTAWTHPTGSASQLDALTTGWYAEFGAICGGTGQCTASNSMTNSSNSGDIELFINQTGSSKTFTSYDSSGNALSNFNPAATGCTYSGSLFTVAAHTICFEDLGTGGSIDLTINAPAVPEPTGVGLAALGVLGIAGLIRRRKSVKA